MQDLLLKTQDLLDTQNLSPELDLKDFEEWDSLAMIALMSFIQKHYQAKLDLDILSQCKNLQNIYEAIKKTQGGGAVTKYLLLSIFISQIYCIYFIYSTYLIKSFFIINLIRQKKYR